jgi:hypothetical protein
VTIDVRKEVRRVADLEERMPRLFTRCEIFRSAFEYSAAV